MPLSSTANCQWPLLAEAQRRTLGDSSRRNLMALPSRFWKSCTSWVWSPMTGGKGWISICAVVLAHQPFDVGQYLNDDRFHVDLFQRLLRLAGAGVLQQVFDQAIHSGHARDHLVEIVFGRRVKLISVFFLKHLAIAGDRQQGRSQIVGHHGREILQLAVAAGKLCGAGGHRLLQVQGVTIDAFEAGAMNLPQQLGAIAEFLHVSEGAQVESLLDRVVRGGARVDDDANLVVEAADAFQELGSAEVGQAEVDDGHAEITLLDVIEGLPGRTASDYVKPFLAKD